MDKIPLSIFALLDKDSISSLPWESAVKNNYGLLLDAAQVCYNILENGKGKLKKQHGLL